jgi:hypothetical protein
MDRSEHIHVISAGESIHTAYPATFRSLPGITRTYVLATGEDYTIAPDAEVERHRQAVRNAAVAVREISASLGIPFAREMVFPPVYPSVLAILAKVRRDHPGARFTFDLSGGPKELCMALQATAPWVGAEVWCSFDGKGPSPVPVPDRNIRQMMENVNYQTILALLLRRPEKNDLSGDPAWRSREYLYRQLSSQYVPTRSKRVKTLPGDPWRVPDRSGKGQKTVPELTHGTFSDFMRALEECGLVDRQESDDGRRQRGYRITGAGTIAFRFLADPGTGPLVRQVLDDK